MKSLISAILCLLTVTVVYARISSEDGAVASRDKVAVSTIVKTSVPLDSFSTLPTLAFGLIGAAAMGAVIATRRSRTHHS